MRSSEETQWRRQAALFAAGVSALIGVGTIITVVMLARDAPRRTPPPAPAVQDQR